QSEALRSAVRELRQVALLEHVEAEVVRRRPTPARASRRTHQDVLENRHVPERPRDLVRPADAEPAAPGRAGPGHVGAAEAHEAGLGAERARQDVEERGLAGPVRAHDPHRLAGGHAEADLVEYG